MSSRNYWLDLFTGTTWREFLDAGANVSGFRRNRWRTVQQIQQGDYLLCYLTGLSRWIGILEVTSEPFVDDSPIWHDADFPCRVSVKPVVHLTPETAVPVLDMSDQLTIFQNLSSPFAWTGHFRGSPARWKAPDGEAVVRALREAQLHPVHRQFDQRKLDRRPKLLGTKIGSVVVPEREESAEVGAQDSTANLPSASVPVGGLEPPEEVTREVTVHEEIQWLLLKLGSDMGLDVWVARNDRGREVNGNRFADLPRIKRDLPLQFDDRTNLTIQLIDVLWLRGNAIVAAFEIESTTSIYSGLLRMSDLISLQPNINIPLYLVAPDDRRDKVFTEVNRPTFSRLSPPMREMCRFISFSTLRSRVSEAASFVRYLRPEFVQEFAEVCEIDDV
ncbi:MAG TPA: hypothetical protein VFU78_04905 [Thermomicrobiales bacterium]|nr:hypothetical protein [Thermomicrobiales bacterium]